MSLEDLNQTVLVNRLFLILIFVIICMQFAFIGLMAFLSVQAVGKDIREWRNLAIMIGSVIRGMQATVESVNSLQMPKSEEKE